MNEEGCAATTMLPKPRRTWIRSLFVGLVVLLCGVLIGAAGATYFLSSRILMGLQHPEMLPERITQRMHRRLQLSDEQAEAVLAIHIEHMERIQDLRREMRPQIEDIFSSLNEEITAVLTPEQATLWNKRFERAKELFLPQEVGP